MLAVFLTSLSRRVMPSAPRPPEGRNPGGKKKAGGTKAENKVSKAAKKLT